MQPLFDRRAPSVEYLPFVKITTDKTFLALLGDWEGCWMHWKPGRSRPCLGPAECPASTHNLPLKWQGFMPCAHLHVDRETGKPSTSAGQRCILTISPMFAKLLTEIIKPPFRGKIVQIVANRTKTRWSVQPVLVQLAEALPDCPNVLAALLRIWGLVDPPDGLGLELTDTEQETTCRGSDNGRVDTTHPRGGLANVGQPASGPPKETDNGQRKTEGGHARAHRNGKAGR
jgi:hypothetical protein